MIIRLLVAALCCLLPNSAELSAAEDQKAESAKAESPKARSTAKITYVDHLEPVLRSNCFKCHNGDRKAGGLDMTTYTNLMAGGSSGEVIAPGDPDGSRLWKLVSHQETPVMPPNGPKIAAASLQVIKKFIELGALETVQSKARIKKRPTFDLVLDDVSTGRPEGPPPMPQQLSLQPVTRTTRAGQVTALASSPWAPLVAVAGQKQVLLYHSDTLQLVGVLPFEEGVPYVLSFSQNGGLLLAGGGLGAESGKVVVWDVRTGQRVITVGDEWDAVLAADLNNQQTLISLGSTNKLVRLFETRSSKLFTEIKKHTDWVYQTKFSPDGVLLATADRSGGVHIWEGYTGRAYLTLGGHKEPVTGMDWRADSNILATCSEDGQVRLWEMNQGKQVKSWSAGTGLQCLDFSRDGKLVTCGRDKIVRLWKADGSKIKEFSGLTEIAVKCALTHDGKRIVAGDWSGKILVWDVESGKPIGQLTSNPPTLQERLKQSQTASAAAEKQHKTAVQALQSAQGDVDALLQQRQQHLAEAQKAAKELQAANLAAQRAEGEVARVVQLLATLQQQAAQQQKTLKKLGERLQAISDEEQPAKGDSLQAEISKAKGTLAAVNEQLQQQRALKHVAQKRLTAEATKRKAAQAKKNDQSKAAEQLLTPIKAAKTQLAQAQKALQKAEAELASKRRDLKRWQEAVAWHEAKFGYEVTDAR